MVCDGGRTFTVAYANGFETAIVEVEGQRLELERLYSATAMTPTARAVGARAAGMFDRSETGFGSRNAFDRQRGNVAAAGPAGVRYGNDEALFVSRNQAAVLQVGDDIYSNCAVSRT
jgi:hypothetical protein